MTVFVLERATPALRGLLTRWMLELKPGVFVGTLSAEVRERLWDKIIGNLRAGAAFLVEPAVTEQKFRVHHAGRSRREVHDFEGISLVRLARRKRPAR